MPLKKDDTNFSMLSSLTMKLTTFTCMEYQTIPKDFIQLQYSREGYHSPDVPGAQRQPMLF
jgi:hypothetical protein